MRITHTLFFRTLCRLLIFCLAFQSLHPSALRVPWKLHLSFNPVSLTLNFELGTLNFGPSPVYGQVIDPNLASTPEADLSDPFIINKAAELNHDPVKIFTFMRDEIGYEAYQGSLRGARGTLWSKAGNALDQASLMIALLRASGVKARYVKGALGLAEAQEVIMSMFPPVLRIVGCPPADALKADPANDPKLLAEAKDHYWVEYGDSFTPADPSIPDAQIGQTFTTKESDFTEVPDNLRHKVTVRLKAELQSNFPSAEPDTKNVLNETFITAALVGKPLSVGHFVNSQPAGGLVFDTVTHTYSPYILIGQNDGDISDDPIIRGTDYQEVITNFPLGSQLLSGLFLEMDVKSPDGKVETHERALVDRIGFAARQNGGMVIVNISNEEGGQPAITDADIVTISAISSSQDPTWINSLTARLQVDKLKAENFELRLRNLTDTTLNTERVNLLQEATSFARASNIYLSALATSVYFLVSDAFNNSLMQTFETRSYPGAAKIILGKIGITRTGGESVASPSLDIITNSVSTISRPGQRKEVEQFHNFARGYFANRIEGEIVHLFSQNVEPITTAKILERALIQHIDLRSINRTNQQLIETLQVSDEAKARIALAVKKGLTVIVPIKAVEIDSYHTVGWFEFDPITGHLVDRLENGQGGEFLEYIIATLQGSETSAIIGGFILPTILLVLRVTGGILQQVKDFLLGAAAALGSNDFNFTQTKTVIAANAVAEMFIQLYKIAAALQGRSKIAFVETFTSAGVPLAMLILSSILLALDPPVPDFLIGFSRFEAFPVTQYPGVSTQLVHDALFTIPPDDSVFPFVVPQLSSAYRIQIKNTGPATDTFRITLPPAPQGYTLQSSVPEITVPPGQTAEVGICLRPVNGIGAPETSVPFNVTVTSTTNPAITASDSETFVTPDVHGVTLTLDPAFTSANPGSSMPVELTITAAGNGAENVTLSADLPDGVTLNDLPSSISLAQGETKTFPLTLNVSNSAALNSTLTTTITAYVTGLSASNKPSTTIQLSIRSAAVVAVEQAAIKAADANHTQLAGVLSQLSDTLGQWQANPDDTRLCERVQLQFNNVKSILEATPALAKFVSQLDVVLAEAASCNATSVLLLVGPLFEDIDNVFASTQALALSLSPTSITLEPGQGQSFNIRLENQGKQTLDVSLAPGSVPSGVTVALDETRVSLAPNAVRTIPLTLNQTLTTTTVFALEVVATAGGASQTAFAYVAVRPAVADVVSVTANPNAVDKGQSTTVSAQILNAANTTRSVLARLELLDSTGALLSNRPDVPVTLTPSTDTLTVNLGQVSTTTLADGLYTLRASLLTTDRQPLSGRAAQTPFFVGAPVSASVSADPMRVPPGTSTVTTQIAVTNQTAIGTGETNGGRELVEGNLTQLISRVTVNASTFFGGFPATRVIDGDLNTSWFTASGDAANLGHSPFLEVLFPVDATVTQLRMFGNREFADDFDFFAGTFQLFDANANVLFDSGVVNLPEPNRDLTLAVPNVAGVRRVRFTATADESDEPGFAELEVIGSAFVPRLQGTLKWSWTSPTVLPTSINVLMTPSIVDLDGDGIPEVVFGSTDSTGGGNSGAPEVGVLRALHGQTGAEYFTVTDPALAINADSGSLAVGDIDNDGKPDIIACDSTGTALIAFEHDGTFKWRSPTLEQVGWGAPAIADLDQDGVSEIIVGRQVLNNDGSIRWTGTGGKGDFIGLGPLSLVADVNLDGRPDVVAGNTVYTASGAILWQNDALPDGFNAIGNFDDDPFPEIVLSSGQQVWLLEHDGTIKWGPVTIPGDGASSGPPTVADYDNDGKPEIGVASANRYVVLETDGSLKWESPIQDGTSAVTGSSVFDFEGDGSAEVIYRDELKLRVYRGTDGFVLFETPMSSCTWYEYIPIADVDGDGHAEIVATANTNCDRGPQQGIFVFGSQDWVSTRKIWNQHTYHITNVTEDGAIPRIEENNWQVPGLNNYRLNTFGPGDRNSSDLSVQLQHSLSNSGYVIDPLTISPAAAAVSASAIRWTGQRPFNNPTPLQFQVSGEVRNMAPGEVRQISLGTDVVATLTAADGSQITKTISLPPLTVVAAHMLDLDPTTHTVERGAQTTYSVRLTNPFSTDQTFTLSTIGLAGLDVSLNTSVAVPAGQTVTIPLSVTVPAGTAEGTRVFSVQAQFASSGVDTVDGELIIAGGAGGSGSAGDPPPPVSLDSLAVDLGLTPTTAIAGQGTEAVYFVRVTNVGDEADTYVLSGSFPAEFTTTFETSSVTVLPGLGNYRDVKLTVTPPPGTPVGDQTFTVRAVSQADNNVQDDATGTVAVVGLGVDVALNPSSGGPGSIFQMTVKNTGNSQDTFALTLAGPAALDTTLGVASVTLAPGATETVPITVGPLSFALPGNLALTGVATSQANTTVRDQATATVTVGQSKGVSAAFNPTFVELPTPGPAAFLFQVNNIGNGEDAYTAEIISTSGPVTTALNGLNDEPTQKIDLFRLPGLSTGGILLNATLTSLGEGKVTVKVTSLTDSSLSALAVATVRTPSTPSPVPLDPFLCYRTRSTIGDICAADAPKNANGPCVVEEDCGGRSASDRHFDETDFCMPDGFPRGLPLSLNDQFESGIFALQKSVNLCNPASIDKAAINDTATHLREFQIKLSTGQCSATAPKNVGVQCHKEEDCGGITQKTAFCAAQPTSQQRTHLTVTNRLQPDGDLKVDLAKPDRLLDPAAKDHVQPQPPPDPASHNVDHYKCYRVKLSKDALPFPDDLQVRVVDQFDQGKLYDLTRATRLCSPVEVNGGSVKDEATSLMCYQARQTPKVCAANSPRNAGNACQSQEDCGGRRHRSTFCQAQPKHQPVTSLFVSTELLSEQVDTIKEDELCVPSEVTE